MRDKCLDTAVFNMRNFQLLTNNHTLQI